MYQSTHCSVCDNLFSGQVLQLGLLPPCNRFQVSPDLSADRYQLSITQCHSCELVQLMHAPSASDIVPRISWLHYNEPEAHLDDVVNKLMISVLNKGCHVLGVGPFDAPLIARLKAGVSSCNELNLLSGAKISSSVSSQKFPYLETMQAQLNPDSLGKISQKTQSFDLVVCRYLLEHCHDPVNALTGLQTLVNKNGYILIEVPDSAKFLACNDYSFIWEEHLSYFTESSLRNFFQLSGYKVINLWKYEGVLEDTLIALVQLKNIENSISKEIISLEKTNQQMDSFKKYASSFHSIKVSYNKLLSSLTASGGKIAIFGAGHQGIIFINALNLGSYINFIIDDDVNKQGYYSPGTGIPIVPSSILLTDSKIVVCLLAVNPRLEAKIQEKFRVYTQRGEVKCTLFSLVVVWIIYWI